VDIRLFNEEETAFSGQMEHISVQWQQYQNEERDLASDN
jgi:hypothetical protein